MIELIMIAAFALVVVCYLYFMELPRRRTAKEKRASHYNEKKVITQTKSTTFEFYNEKLQTLLAIWVIPTTAGVLIPRMILPFPINLVTSAFVAVIMLFVVVLINIQLSRKEEQGAQNNAFGTGLVHYSEHGDQNQLFRNAKFESMVYMGEVERTRVVDRIMGDVQSLEFYKKNKEDIDLDKTREQLIKAVMPMKVIRYLIDEGGAEFRILFITDTDPKDLRTPNNVRMIHRTVNVQVPLMPFWGYYGGTTSRLFKSMNDSGETSYVQRRMGIILDMFNLEKRNELLLTGEFTNPDKMTMLLGEYLHLFEQQQPTAEEMNKIHRRIERRDLESKKEEFREQAEANKLVQTTKHLLEVLSQLLRPRTRNVTDYVLMVFIAVMSLAAGFLLWG